MAAVVLAAATAGCGIGGRPGATAGAGGASTGPLAFATCMRSHGVPDFPDPPGGGGPQGVQIQPDKVTVDGVTLKETPAEFHAGQQACQAALGGAAGGGAPNPQMVSAADAFAQCMRSHGIPNFPDPKVTGNGIGFHVPAGTSRNSPQFQAAQGTCQSLLSGPGTRGKAAAGG